LSLNFAGGFKIKPGETTLEYVAESAGFRILPIM
jgi:hypothetical protein